MFLHQAIALSPSEGTVRTHNVWRPAIFATAFFAI